MKKYDKIVYGVLAGVILPVIGFFVSYPIKARGTVPFDQYVEMAKHGDNQQDILIFCLIPNMFLFYFSNFRWDMYNFTRGLVGVTLLLGLGLFALTL